MQIRRLLLKPEKMASPISFSTTIHLSWEFSSLYSLTSSTLASASISRLAFLLLRRPLQIDKLSTGDSLDISPQDDSSITANDATVKDMEGEVVAYVAEMLKVPVIFVKAVTDIVVGDKPSAVEFLQNLASVTAALDESVTRVVDFG
ncbi:5'-methylthioadenosine/S-adenosylhomocysteine nucleosidase [Linum perenne]